ncbi:MAG: metallophosphoesterase [Planctomycetota bacterium]
MKIGIMSDSHDNLPLIEKALRVLRERSAEVVLHAGDFVAPFAAKTILRGGLPVRAVLGNNDGEKNGLRKVLPGLVDPPLVLTLAGKKFVLVHDLPEAGDLTEIDADCVVFGHTHEPQIRRGRPLVVNPGETGGWLTGRPQIAFLDTERMDVEFVSLLEERR